MKLLKLSVPRMTLRCCLLLVISTKRLVSNFSFAYAVPRKGKSSIEGMLLCLDDNNSNYRGGNFTLEISLELLKAYKTYQWGRGERCFNTRILAAQREPET